MRREDQEWDLEIDRRMQAYERGEMTMHEGDEVLREARALLRAAAQATPIPSDPPRRT